MPGLSFGAKVEGDLNLVGGCYGKPPRHAFLLVLSVLCNVAFEPAVVSRQGLSRQ